MSDDLGTAPPVVEGPRPGPASDTSKLLAALSYPLWLPVAIIALLLEPYKTEPFVKFHAIQSIGLGIALYVVNFVLGMTGIGVFLAIPLSIAGFIYQIVLALKAWNGEYVEVPMVYGFVKNYI